MLTMKDIIREGHPTLRKIADEVVIPLSAEDKKIGQELLDYVINSQEEEIAQKYGLRGGVGLAAPQINVSKKIIAVHTTDEKDKLFSYVLFNPKIISHSVGQTYLPGGEGCLSVDRAVEGYVPRYTRITVKGIAMNGKEVKLKLQGYVAIVFQHEIDHLNGVMFYDRINKDNPLVAPEGAEPLLFE